ncbi:hypothetical protein GGH94_003256 [Coemansia aciculifera]|uniref:Uncharacterized protein n=1 Tax=Coemansia aciculifera TaxID=417176 RepID=A0A9W8M5X9_9FUNG|nr:hypothetical protein GGH94_003256 [Coemansia aciculifera]KAJ2876575.1 hypothetical protein GGH93_000671 [Coemansia aciculifera]
MTHHSGSPPPLPPSVRAHQLIGSIFGSRRPPTEHQPPQSDPLPAQMDANDVPELLKPSVQWYSDRWDAVQRRQSATVQQCKQTDARLGLLLTSLRQHHDSAQLLARELSLLPDTTRNLAALKTQADELKPVLASLDQLYTTLAATDVRWMPELVAHEAEFRHNRHAHYQQLQASMDEQYADMRRQSVSTRAANAERSFQRDLETYHQRQSSPLWPQRAPQSGARGLAEVVLAPNAWIRDDDAASGFFSDDEDDGDVKSSKGSAGTSARERKDDNGSKTPPGFTVLGDDDFV